MLSSISPSALKYRNTGDNDIIIIINIINSCLMAIFSRTTRLGGPRQNSVITFGMEKN